MTQGAADPMETVIRRLREVRRRRGLTAAELAQRMTEVGVLWDRAIVANLESGRRRTVSVTELLALGVVLNVAPVHLLVPVEDVGRYQVTPKLDASVFTVRNWIRGVNPLLPGQSQREYLAEIPEGEFLQVTRRMEPGG